MALKPVKGKIQSQELNDNFSYLDSAIKKIDKGSPKGVFDTVQELKDAFPDGDNGVYVVDTNWYFWGGSNWEKGGVYQARDINDGSVTISKFEQNLRKDFQDLFNAFVEQDDFIPVELFDKSKVKQGGVTSSGTTNSTTRTHIEINVVPGKEYYVTIPNSQFLRIRSISSWSGNSFIEWNQTDAAFSGNRFVVSPGVNKVIVSFCKVNTSENLSVKETITELVSIFELKMNKRNLITRIVQGGITYGGVFTDNPNRTRSDLITVPPFSICRVIVNESAGISIRNLHGYSDGKFVVNMLSDHDDRFESLFTIPSTVNQVALSFSKVNPNTPLSTTETLNAKPNLEVSYK